MCSSKVRTHWGAGALHLAARGDRPEMVRLLLSRGASPLSKDEDGRGVLSYATGNNRATVLAVIRALHAAAPPPTRVESVPRNVKRSPFATTSAAISSPVKCFSYTCKPAETTFAVRVVASPTSWPSSKRRSPSASWRRAVATLT